MSRLERQLLAAAWSKKGEAIPQAKELSDLSESFYSGDAAGDALFPCLNNGDVVETTMVDGGKTGIEREN